MNKKEFQELDDEVVVLATRFLRKELTHVQLNYITATKNINKDLVLETASFMFRSMARNFMFFICMFIFFLWVIFS